MNRLIVACLLVLTTACGSSDVRATLALEGGPGGDHDAAATVEDNGGSVSIDTLDGDAVSANVTAWFKTAPKAGTYHCADLVNASWSVATSDHNWEAGCLIGPAGADVTVELLEVTQQGGGYVMHGRATGSAAPKLDAPGSVTVNAVF